MIASSVSYGSSPVSFWKIGSSACSGGLSRVGSLQEKVNKHMTVGMDSKLTSHANLSMPSSLVRVLIPVASYQYPQLVCGVE